MSSLLPELQQYARDTQGRRLCIYVYILFRNDPLTDQKAYNKAMSQVRVSVEWLFGDTVNWFKFLDFKKRLKIYLSAVGKMYLTCALLTSARTCLYGKCI